MSLSCLQLSHIQNNTHVAMAYLAVNWLLLVSPTPSHPRLHTHHPSLLYLSLSPLLALIALAFSPRSFSNLNLCNNCFFYQECSFHSGLFSNFSSLNLYEAYMKQHHHYTYISHWPPFLVFCTKLPEIMFSLPPLPRQNEMKPLPWRDICAPMCTATLYIIARTWKQPQWCVSTDKWKMCDYHLSAYLSTYPSIYHGILFSHKERRKQHRWTWRALC